MLSKTYQPSEVEGRIYRLWEDAGAFECGRPERLAVKAEPYCIVIPPPNVTGSLHMGHALNNTLQDVLIRYERMRGKDVLWQPGTDHAGIATQSVVERQLMQRQEPDRRSMGRDAFLARVWEWKEESGGTIINQLRRLGASCDWSRERFTMDEGLSEAVLKVFVELYRQGLIYKDKRLVNWDPKLLTAISDLEVQSVETKGHMWHFKYPIKDREGAFITVATTRPETMLGDTAVAVHPEDARYKDLIGKSCILPLVNREIPIIADEYADPEQGSGAVKITPAHDFNDFEIGKRHGLAMINILDEHANLQLDPNLDFKRGVDPNPSIEKTIKQLNGLDRFVGRERIVEMMAELGLVERTEDHILMVPYGDRSQEVIEPWLTDQWYVDAETLAEPAIKAVEDGRTVFVPKSWEKTYFEWMRNIQPWCISRQLWWGHQIPCWYGPGTRDDGGLSIGVQDDELGRLDASEHARFVAASEAEAVQQAEELYGRRVIVVDQQSFFLEAFDAFFTDKSKPIPIYRDEDVLDTWFSSALWPFSTLGWPEETPELARYYPTSVLVTAFDIIFFWVARMMMMGLHFMKDVPFGTVYIHALVRDEQGQKMSKSKGNIIDPLELMDEFGADALRFTLAAMAAQGRDIRLSRSRVEGYRNFATKLWNAARFSEMNECVRVEGFDPASAKYTVNRWIAGEAQRAAAAVAEGIETHRYNDAAAAAYHFVWHVFCDWYLELIKPVLNGTDDVAIAETRAMTAWTLDLIIKLLHPFMPFITEELWWRLAEHGPARKTSLILADWPALTGLEDGPADAEIGWVIRLITEVRSLRSEMNVPPSAKMPLYLVEVKDETAQRAEAHEDTIKRLVRLDTVIRSDSAPKGSVQLVVDDAIIALPLGDIVDLGAEQSRLQREITKFGGEIDKLDAKLSNEKFTSRAPEHVVEEQRERRHEAVQTVKKLEDALKRLQAAV